MGLRFPMLRFGAALAAGVLCAFSMPAPAQEAQPPQADPAPPAKLPRPQRGDRTQNLDFLFGALKAAPDADSAKAIEERIWALWFVSGSDTTDLLMTRVKSAIDGKEIDLALELLNAIIELK